MRESEKRGQKIEEERQMGEDRGEMTEEGGQGYYSESSSTTWRLRTPRNALHIQTSLSPSLFPPFSLSLYLFISLFLNLSLFLTLSLSIHLSLPLSLYRYLSLPPSIYLSISCLPLTCSPPTRSPLKSHISPLCP
jgi:hypothetical protein